VEPRGASPAGKTQRLDVGYPDRSTVESLHDRITLVGDVATAPREILSVGYPQ
jgi:hypothetical protein